MSFGLGPTTAWPSLARPLKFAKIQVNITLPEEKHVIWKMDTKMGSMYIACTGCFRKKYGVADYQYFENGKMQQCDIFGHSPLNVT